MKPRLAARTLVALAAALVAAAVARAEAPTIYKWIDENGVAHYTTDRDRIPSAIRNRVERPARDVAAPPHYEDVMRDAVRTKPKPPVATQPPVPVREPVAVEPPAAVSDPAPIQPERPAPPATAAIEAPPSPPPSEIEEISAPAPERATREVDPVSAPPPAPAVPLEPEQTTELAKLDSEIQSVEGEIAAREESLAALLSSPDEERTTPLIDDPSFREISRHLPKLQAELQTLRERRNKIQSPATP